jgi:phospholipid/cholesterol/gamma-HCH transport system substrate-binding protein
MKGRNEAIVGVFITVAVLVGIAGTLWLARRGFTKSYPMYARFAWGSNLKPGQQVLLAGVQVGFVEQVKLNPAGYLEVAMSIDKQYQVPEGTTATVQNEGIFGDKSVALTPCRPPNLPPALQSPGASAAQNGRAGSDTADAPPVCRTGAFLPAGDTIPTGKGAPTMDEILTRVDSMSGALSDVVQAVRVQMVQEGGIRDLHRTIASTNALVQQLQGVAAEQSRALALTLASIRRATSALDSASLDSTVRNMEVTTRNLSTLTSTLEQTTGRLDRVMQSLETGNGTAAKLLNDPGVYNNLRESLARLDSLLTDVKANPKRYINVKVF